MTSRDVEGMAYEHAVDVVLTVRQDEWSAERTWYAYARTRNVNGELVDAQASAPLSIDWRDVVSMAVEALHAKMFPGADG